MQIKIILSLLILIVIFFTFLTKKYVSKRKIRNWSSQWVDINIISAIIATSIFLAINYFIFGKEFDVEGIIALVALILFMYVVMKLMSSRIALKNSYHSAVKRNQHWRKKF